MAMTGPRESRSSGRRSRRRVVTPLQETTTEAENKELRLYPEDTAANGQKHEMVPKVSLSLSEVKKSLCEFSRCLRDRM